MTRLPASAPFTRHARAPEREAAVLTCITANPGVSVRRLRRFLPYRNAMIDAVIADLLAQGAIVDAGDATRRRLAVRTTMPAARSTPTREGTRAPDPVSSLVPASLALPARVPSPRWSPPVGPGAFWRWTLAMDDAVIPAPPETPE